MTDKKLTDEEIINALEGSILNAKWCDSKAWSIEIYKLESALDLINRQKAEKAIKAAKAEAYKEFAEKLKKDLFYKCGDINYSETCDFRKLIDNLLKEMVGEEE